MKKFILLTIIALMPLNLLALDNSDIRQWLKHYYTHKDKKQIEKFIQRIDNPETLNTIEAPLTGAIPFLILNHDPLIHYIYNHHTSNELKRIATKGLYMFEAPFLIPTEHQIKKQLQPISLIKHKPFTPKEIDILWGAFMVTGENQFIDQIITALEPHNHIITKEATRYTLTIYMQKHKKVFNRVQEHLNKKNPHYAEIKEVWDMYHKNEKHKPLP